MVEHRMEIEEEFSYRFDGKSDTHIFTICKKEYKFDIKDSNFLEIIERHPNIREVFFTISEEPIQTLLQLRNEEKVTEIAEFANHGYYTALESYFEHLKLLLEFKKANPDKKENDLIPNDSLDKCCICLCELYDNICDYSLEKIKQQLRETSDDDVISLEKCQGHYFHKACLLSYIKNQKMTFLKCPICSVIYGVLKGDLPEGEIRVTHDKSIKCSGYSDCGSIIIHYSMKGGKKNGVSFSGTSRTAYLPDNRDGNEVLRLLKIAFERRLIFTVGDSITSGAKNVIVWNGIHHKTSPTGGTSNYGYPDPTYFSRVKQELAAKGVY